jgi:hypothetical protein
MYLAMEEWFHDCNDKDEVKSSRTAISKVLSSMQRLFPRDDNTNGYNIPKMHGMTKMQVYIQLFGSAINFYGGPGEAAHKTFVKSAGQKTQRRVSEFAKQTANQYYNMMLTSYAVSNCVQQIGELKQLDGSPDEVTETEILNNYLPDYEFGNDDDTVQLSLSGKFDFHISKDVINKMATDGCVDVNWTFDDVKKRGNTKYTLKKMLLKMIHRKLTTTTNDVLADETQVHINTVTGYTKLCLTSISSGKINFYAHPCFQGEEWYDWAMVHFEETNDAGEALETYYPSKLLGFITINNEPEAYVQCSVKQLMWNAVETDFIHAIQLGTDFNVSYVSVPINSIVHPLCVFPDNGDDPNRFFVVLPKRNWSRFFGNKIDK